MKIYVTTPPTIPVAAWLRRYATELIVVALVVLAMFGVGVAQTLYSNAATRIIISEASGQTILGLARLAEASGSRIVGIGALIEKTFEGGRNALKTLNVPIESLACIISMEDDQIVFGEPV